MALEGQEESRVGAAKDGAMVGTGEHVLLLAQPIDPALLQNAARVAADVVALAAKVAEVSRRVDDLAETASQGRRERDALARAVDSALQALAAHPIERWAAGDRAVYQRLVYRLRGMLQAAVPQGSVVAVVSRGDEELLRLPGLHARHFPSTNEAVYAGHHPADSDEAISLLEAARAQGVRYLAFPVTSLWWLEHYGGFAAHLDARYRVVARDPDTCVVYELERAQEGTLEFPRERVGR